MSTRGRVCGAAIGAFGIYSQVWAQPAPTAAARCAEMNRLQVPGVSMTISKAEWVEAGSRPAPAGGAPAPAAALPAYCRIDGTIDRREGLNKQSYGIGFAIALPEPWNGRFLMQGGGGLNGRITMPLGAQASGERPALARGFAVVTTDSGHQSTSGFDATFMEDQQAALDFAFLAVGRVALVGKDLVRQYYGRPASKSYFTGCSTGGREGMVMAQRYPTYFDGIVSGAPAMRTGHSNLALRSVVVGFNQIAPKDAAGQPISSQAFSDADRSTIVDALLAKCDATDGVKDGMIFDVRGCAFDPASLTCKGAKADGCLSPAQVSTLTKAFAGPRNSKGEPVYPGFAYDTGIAARGGGIPGILMAAGPPVPPRPGMTQDVDREARIADMGPLQLLTDTSTWTNLNTFSGHGGKLIFFHGVSDPWFSALDTIDYYERLGEANGGAAQVQTWSRLFLSPGMGHCGGGAAALDRFDLLTAIVDWVEQGQAPDAVPATGRALPGRSRPLCAYPKHAHYSGTGDPQDWKSFECR